MTLDKTTVMLFGATGTIGRATHRALVDAGYRVVAPVRAPNDTGPVGAVSSEFSETELADLMMSSGCVAVMSCVASRTGTPADAREIDCALNQRILRAALSAKVRKFILLSAICVQKPMLAFQHAKLSFEADLQRAPLTWSIVRPTAYFKSLSGQLKRVQAGKPFLVFGDGAMTACKPISDADLAAYLVACLTDPTLQNRILPIGGAGPAITPRAQGQLLFAATGQTPKFKSVPIALLSVIIGGLTVAGWVVPRLREKAELARIGRYYATESMLLWDPDRQSYDADATPEYGSDTLAEHYRQLIKDGVPDDRGDHAVF